MDRAERTVEIAMELQALSRNALTYVKDKYDKERFEKISELAAELLSIGTELDKSVVVEIFSKQKGYQTPKVETRGVVFDDGKILLVQQNNKWALPGGWMEYNLTVSENTIKEVEEESGYSVEAKKVIAVQNRSLHNSPKMIFEVIKIFVECRLISGEFKENLETSDARFFTKDEVSFLDLDIDKTTSEQIEMCFDLCNQECPKTVFD